MCQRGRRNPIGTRGANSGLLGFHIVLNPQIPQRPPDLLTLNARLLLVLIGGELDLDPEL